MSLILTKQKFGTSVKTLVFELDGDIKVNDFSYVPERGFFIAAENGIGLLTLKNNFMFPYINNIKKPKAIYYQKNKRNFYVIDGYRNLKYFNIDNTNSFNIMGENNKRVFDKYLSKTCDDGCNVDVAADSAGNVYYVHSGLSRCLKVNGSKTSVFMGNGKSGFSIATRLEDCLLNEPSGVSCDGKNIYISDTGNCCIRNIVMESRGDKMRSPIKCKIDKINPSKIVAKKKLIYYLDKNSIRYITLGTLDGGVIYKTDNNIVSMDVGEDKFLYILSEK